MPREKILGALDTLLGNLTGVALIRSVLCALGKNAKAWLAEYYKETNYNSLVWHFLGGVNTNARI